ncbi:hypothetical protein ACJX0J_022470, partial [Zea mays]
MQYHMDAEFGEYSSHKHLNDQLPPLLSLLGVNYKHMIPLFTSGKHGIIEAIR